MTQGLQYTVRAGDTLGRIAVDNGTTVAALAALNGLVDPDRIAAGRVLVLPAAAQARYVVRRGDSLSAIATRFGVSTAALAAINRIADPDRIGEGAVLVIPEGRGEPTGTVAAAGLGASPAPETVPDDPWRLANLRLAPANEVYRPHLAEAAQRTAMPAQAVAAIIDAEAAKRPVTGAWLADSKAATSSATGLTQFLDATWRGEARRAGSLLGEEAARLGCIAADGTVQDDKALLAMRLDPRVAILAGADFARTNLVALRRAGALRGDADPAGLAKLAYLAHHEGAGRAVAFLKGRMGYVSFAILGANVPDAGRRKRLLDSAGGQVGPAYRAWLCGYVDSVIDIRRFMVDPAGVSVPALASYFVPG